MSCRAGIEGFDIHHENEFGRECPDGDGELVVGTSAPRAPGRRIYVAWPYFVAFRLRGTCHSDTYVREGIRGVWPIDQPGIMAVHRV